MVAREGTYYFTSISHAVQKHLSAVEHCIWGVDIMIANGTEKSQGRWKNNILSFQHQSMTAH